MTKRNFNCSGKVNINDWNLNNGSLLLQREVENVLNGRKSGNNINFHISDYELPTFNALSNLKLFERNMRSKLNQLSRHEKLTTFGSNIISNKDTDYFSMREEICNFLFSLRDYLQSVEEEDHALKSISDDSEKNFDELLNTIQVFLNRLRRIPDSTFLYATSNNGNKCNQPEYHMYHIHLDLRWLIITLIYIQNNLWNNISNNFENLENTIYTIIGDLIYISIKIFATTPIADLRLKTPYSCTCLRELWLMLQIFTDELYNKGKSKIFWTYVNSILNQLFPNESNRDIPLFQRNLDLPHCKNSELFCLWLIYHLTLLYGYSDNGGYYNTPSSRFTELQIDANINEVEKILKAYVNKGGKDGARDEIDEELCIMIPMLHVLVCEWWKPRVQIITLLWDCFHRRLDQPFLMQTRGPWCLSSEKKTPMDILDQVRERFKNVYEVANESSFGVFLRLLGTFLQKYYNRNDSKIWNQIRGRVYSRFTQNKVQEFSESGLYNFVSLFLTLAVSADLINVCTTMLNLLPPVLESVDSTGDKISCLTWKSKLVVLLLYNEKKLTYKDVAESFTEAANKISCRKDEFSRSMMTWFIDVFRIVLTQSEDFAHHEYAFLGGWIDRYLLDCAPNRVGVLTSTLLVVFEKCRNLQNSSTIGSTYMLNALWNHVASRIRQMVTHCDLSTDFYENPTKLAVAFTLEACYDPATAKKYRHSSVSLFQHFTTSIIIKDIRITRLYLTLVLQNENAVQNLKREINNFNICCIQAWVKSNVLNYEINNETNFLKSYIVNLPEIKEILNTDSDISEFLQSNETIITFLIILSRKRNALKSEQQCLVFDNLCRPFFHNIDKWAIQLINEDNKDSKLSFWIYRCIGTIILCCSSVLYIKNQPNNMFRMLINKVALSPDQPTQPHLMYLTFRIFSMIITGMENLNIKSDISLQTLMRELFEKYLPILITVDNTNENSFKVADTLSKCFLDTKPHFLRYIIDMLTSNFLITSSGNLTHKHCYLVMLLLRSLVRGGKTYSNQVLESIITISITPILNCYIKVHDRHPHKKQTHDLLRDIVAHAYYKESSSIREKLNDAVWNCLVRYNQTKVSFEFLSYSSKISSELYNYLTARFEKIVTECEKNKSSNATNLRYLFENAKKTI